MGMSESKRKDKKEWLKEVEERGLTQKGFKNVGM